MVRSFLRAHDYRMRTWVLGALVCATIVGCVVATCNAEPALPDGTALQPYTNRWIVTVFIERRNQTVEAGDWSDEGRAERVDGQPAFRRTQVFRVAKTGEVRTIVNVFYVPSMQPIARDVTDSGKPDIHIRFDNDGIVTPKRVAIQPPFYDFDGGMYGMLLAMLPLADGLSGTMRSPTEDATGSVVLTYRVMGEEYVNAGPLGKVRAWRVDVTQFDSDGGHMTFWLTKASPYIIRLVYDAPKAGQTFTYDME